MQCPRCFEPFSEDTAVPRILVKCGHTICHICLKNTIDATNSLHINCPFCITEYTIEEAKSLPNNYMILNLMNQRFQEQFEKNSKEKLCGYHGIEMDFYCKVDKIYICSKCFLLGGHYGHEIVNAMDEVEVHRKRATQYVKQVGEKCERIESSRDKFMKYLGDYQSLTKKSVSNMEDRFQKMITKLTKKKEEMFQKFTNSTMMMNKYLKGKITMLNKKHDKLRQHLDDTRRFSSALCGGTADLREIEEQNWEGKVIEEISMELIKEFNLEEKNGNKMVFEEVMREIEEIDLKFNQTPFFVFDEDLYKNYLENFMHVASFDYGVEPAYKLENDIYFPPSKKHPKTPLMSLTTRDFNLTDELLLKKFKLDSIDGVSRLHSIDSTILLNSIFSNTNNRKQSDVKEEYTGGLGGYKQEEEKNLDFTNLGIKIKMEIEEKPTASMNKQSLTMNHEEYERSKEIYQCAAFNSPAVNNETSLVLTRKTIKFEDAGPSPGLFPSLKQEDKLSLLGFSRKDSDQKASASTNCTTRSFKTPWNIKCEEGVEEESTPIGEIKDPFDRSARQEPVVCLLGQNNKALYITSRGESELVSVELEYANKENNPTNGVKKNYVLKNFAGCSYLEDNKVLYVGGGPSNDAYLLEFQSKGHALVTNLAKMNHKRCWHGVVYVKPYAYIIGGYDGKNRLRECEKINLEDPTTAKFESMQPMNEARSHFGYTLFDGKFIYVVGGLGISKKLGPSPIDTVERYDIEKDKWEMLPVRLPLRLSGVSCMYFEEEKKIKIFGGSDSINKSTKLVFELDIDSKGGKLRECNVMMKKRQMNNKIFLKDGRLYLVGGTNENDCESWRTYDTDEERVVEKALLSYDKVIKGDLNYFCGFIV